MGLRRMRAFSRIHIMYGLCEWDSFWRSFCRVSLWIIVCEGELLVEWFQDYKGIVFRLMLSVTCCNEAGVLCIMIVARVEG